MHRIACVFLLCWIGPLSSQDNVPSLAHFELEGDPSAIVAGCVNVITGTYSISGMDLNIPAAEPLHFHSLYCSSDWTGQSLSDGWNHSYVTGYAMLGQEELEHLISIPEPFGAIVNYRSAAGLQCKVEEGNIIDFWAPSKGYFTSKASHLDDGTTNTTHGELSGCTNLKNQTCHFANRMAEVTLCDGGRRIFRECANRLICPILFRIDEEHKPNGNRINYYYDNHILRKIQVTDAAGNRKYGHFDIHFDGQKRTITGSDGKAIQYHMNQERGRTFISQIVRPNGVVENFDYCPRGLYAYDQQKIVKRSLPDERFQLVEYYCEGENAVDGQTIVVKKPEKSVSCIGCVKCLKAPVGHDATPITTHSFLYSFKCDGKDGGVLGDGSYVTVRDAKHHQTMYHLRKGKRLYAIERFLGSDKASYRPYSMEKFFWGKRENGQQCDLICRAFQGADGIVRSCHYLEYDESHNVIADHILGNLSGSAACGSIVLSKDGTPLKNTCESYTTRATYTQNRFHLCESKIFPNGKRIQYRYKEGTNLLKEQATFEGPKMVLMEQVEYDAFNVPCKTISQNGSLSKHVCYISTKQQAPALGLPEVTRDFYVDPHTGHEVLLRRKVNRYNRYGLLEEQDIYNAQDLYCYTLYWRYDASGNVIYEQNALGNIIQRRFDANGNKIFEKGPSQAYYTTFTYDRSNRLISESRWNAHGRESLTKTFCYDYSGNCTASTDIYGHTTYYKYDELDRLIETRLPTGQCIRQSYDIAGNITSLTDAMGGVTATKYNIRNQPTEITYPDSSKEYYEYYLNGALKSHTLKNGTRICYERDCLDNVVKTEVYSNEGQLESVTCATYDGKLCTSETDASGIVISYSYDGEGRVVLIERLNQRQAFEYDDLGRLHKIIDTDCRVTVRLYDLQDHIIEERIEEQDGTVLQREVYAYDAEGNRISTITFGADGPAVTNTVYNWQGKPTTITDPLGNETHIHYDYSRDYTVTTVDAQGNQTIKVHNALGHVVSEHKKNSLGETTSSSTFCYQANGLPVKRVDSIIASNASTPPIQETRWKYDSAGRVIEMAEAYGSALERHTYTSYNLSGQKTAEILPDGTQLFYAYDSMGRLNRYWASDGTLDYHYSYDIHGNLICADDHIHNLKTYREYDAFHRLVREVLGNGLALEYAYDALGRLICLTYPDRTAVRYEYDGKHLRKISRINIKGDVEYFHTYEAYDLSGRVLKASALCAVGILDYKWDQLGRRIYFKAKHFEESIAPHDIDSNGNLMHKVHSDYLGSTNCRYTYDPLHQLTEEEGLFTHKYKNDSLNNRWCKDEQNCEIDALNRLCRQGDVSFSYDLRGNRLTKGATTYSYDAIGRLIKVSEPNNTHEYIYDSFDRRIYKNSETYGIPAQTRYLYQDNLEIGAVDEDDVIFELQVLGNCSGGKIGAAVAVEVNDDVYYPIHDHAGNVIALVYGRYGNLVEFYRFSAFGEEKIYQPGIFYGVHENTKPINPWRFAGKRYDAETKMILFGRRFYDPEIGRWLTTDPRGYDNGPNLYDYVHNRPLTHGDLFGLEACSCTINSSQGGSIEALGENLSTARASFEDVLKNMGQNSVSIVPFQRRGMCSYYCRRWFYLRPLCSPGCRY